MRYKERACQEISRQTHNSDENFPSHIIIKRIGQVLVVAGLLIIGMAFFMMLASAASEAASANVRADNARCCNFDSKKFLYRAVFESSMLNDVSGVGAPSVMFRKKFEDLDISDGLSVTDNTGLIVLCRGSDAGREYRNLGGWKWTFDFKCTALPALSVRLNCYS